MIKVIENLQSNKVKNVTNNIELIIDRLKTLKDNIQSTPKKYDINILCDILCQIYDDVGDFNVMTYDKDNM